MVLENYVTFEEGRPKRLHFTSHAVSDRRLRDPLTGLEKSMTVLAMQVDEEDGLPVAKLLSITSEGLAAQIQGYLSGEQYRAYDYTITRRGAGFGTRYSVTAIPRPG